MVKAKCGWTGLNRAFVWKSLFGEKCNQKIFWCQPSDHSLKWGKSSIRIKIRQLLHAVKISIYGTIPIEKKWTGLTTNLNNSSLVHRILIAFFSSETSECTLYDDTTIPIFSFRIISPIQPCSTTYHCRECDADNWHVMMRDHREIIIKCENVETHHVVALTNAL